MIRIRFGVGLGLKKLGLDLFLEKQASAAGFEPAQRVRVRLRFLSVTRVDGIVTSRSHRQTSGLGLGLGLILG